jgi:dolichol-phosphate hexosyltransferase
MVVTNSIVTVIIPTLNEEEGIGPTIQELQSVMHGLRLLVIDGKSVDKTIEIAKNMGVDVLLQEGQGKGDAVFQALQMLDANSQFVVFTDADYTYPAEFLPKMIDLITQNPNVGMVIGNRFGAYNPSKSLKNPFYVGNKLLAFAQHVMNGVDLIDPLSGLRVVRSEILTGWKPKSKGFDVEAELNALVERKGYKTLEVPINYRDRLGEKKLKLRDGLGIMRRIIAEAF